MGGGMGMEDMGRSLANFTTSGNMGQNIDPSLLVEEAPKRQDYLIFRNPPPRRVQLNLTLDLLEYKTSSDAEEEDSES